MVDLTITGLLQEDGFQHMGFQGLISHPKSSVLEPDGSPLRNYEALSYVWGSDGDPGTVFVGSQRRTLRVTRNLDTALRHLRKPDCSRVMWIDALCIDQSNIKEQNRQVGYMCYIYWSTPRVVVWLGPQADDSDYTVRRLHDIGTRIRFHPTTTFVTGITDEDDEAWACVLWISYLSAQGIGWASKLSSRGRGLSAFGFARKSFKLATARHYAAVRFRSPGSPFGEGCIAYISSQTRGSKL